LRCSLSGVLVLFLRDIPISHTRTFNRAFQEVLRSRPLERQVRPEPQKRLRPIIFTPFSARNPSGLLEFNLSTGCFQLGFDFFSFSFGNAFFDSFAAGIHKVFGFFEAQTSDGADFFDDADFLVTW